MNAGRIAVNYSKIAVNAVWKRLTGRLLIPLEGLAVLEKNFKPNDSFTFIQVGANDGISNDFLYDFVTARKSVGLVIEPVEEYFEHLVFHYRNFPTIIPLNLAVHATEKKLQLFKVKKESLKDLPAWASGIASSNGDHHLSSGINKEHIQSVVVKADHLMNVVKPYAFLKETDYLQIDVEGADDEVLNQIDFTTLKPAVIRFEYMNLSEERTVNAIRLLKQHGYYCFYDAVDVMAVQPKDIIL